MTTSKRRILYAVLALILIAVVIFLCTPRTLTKHPDTIKINLVTVTQPNEHDSLHSMEITDQVDLDALAALLSEVSTGRIPRKFAPYQMHEGDIDIHFHTEDPVVHHHILLTAGKDPMYIAYNDSGSGGFNIRGGSELCTAVEALLP